MLTSRIATDLDEERLANLLSDYAKRFGTRVKKSQREGFVIRIGNYLSLNPDSVSVRFSIKLSGSELIIKAMPWTFFTTKKEQKIAELRLNQLIQWIQEKKEPQLRITAQREGIDTLSGRLTNFFLYFLSAFIFAFVASVILNTFIINRELNEIIGRSSTISSLQQPGLPNSSELSRIDYLFVIKAAVIPSVGLAFLLALSYSIATIIVGSFHRMGYLTNWVMIIFFVLIFLAVYPILGLLVSLPLSLLVAAIPYAGCKLCWSFMNELADYGKKRLLGIVSLALSILCPILIGFDRDPVSLRDSLLSSKPGKKLVYFYYNYTLYPAETLKEIMPYELLEGKSSFQAKQQVVALSTINDRTLEEVFADLHFYKEQTDEQEALKLVESKFYDFYIVDRNHVNLRKLLEEKGLTQRMIILNKPYGGRSTKNAIQLVSNRVFKAGVLRELHSISLLSIQYLSPITLFLILFTSMAKVLYTRKIIISILILLFTAVLSVFYSIATKVHLDNSKLEEYLKSPDPSVRYEAIFMLSKIVTNKDLKFFEPVASLLNDSDERVRLRACECLAKLEDLRATNGSIQALKDPSMLVRYKACEVIGKIGARDAIPHLIEIVKKDKWYVAAYALSALRRD